MLPAMKKTTNEELKDRLKRLRIERGYTQKEVSSAIGMEQPSYSQLESGKSRRTTMIAEIAGLYKVNPLWLATGEGDQDLSSEELFKLKFSQLSPTRKKIILDLIDDYTSHPAKE